MEEDLTTTFLMYAAQLGRRVCQVFRVDNLLRTCDGCVDTAVMKPRVTVSKYLRRHVFLRLIVGVSRTRSLLRVAMDVFRFFLRMSSEVRIHGPEDELAPRPVSV